MNESSAALWETGLYGKLPSQGDFVVRRLPRDFVGPWDDWLQGAVSESRSRLGGNWAGAYQAAPIWRFILAPSLCGPGAWAGIIQPSVDRVGRYFPLTVAARVSNDVDPLTTLLRGARWHDSIETAAESAFDASTAFDDLDRRIGRIGFPPRSLVLSEVSGDDTLPVAGREFDALSYSIQAGDSPASIRSALFSRFVSLELAGCVWLTRGTAAVGPTLLVSKKLPSARQFCGMLVGCWEEHDWEPVVRVPSPEAGESRLVAGGSAQVPVEHGHTANRE